MIKLNILYPGAEGARFDHAYYRDQHMPMVAERLGAACHSYTVERAAAGGAPGAAGPCLAACSVYGESLESLQRALAPHAKEMMADARNYTDARPMVWFSEVVADTGAQA